MTKQQMNVRIPNITRKQISAICLQQNMTAGEVVTLAVDRLTGTLPAPLAFYITGENGSYLEIEDGRYADTVAGETNVGDFADKALETLLSIETEDVGQGEWESWSHWDNDVMSISEYVCA